MTSLPKTYRDLCEVLLHRKIHDGSELEAAQEIIDFLAVLPTRTPDQDDYLAFPLAGRPGIDELAAKLR